MSQTELLISLANPLCPHSPHLIFLLPLTPTTHPLANLLASFSKIRPQSNLSHQLFPYRCYDLPYSGFAMVFSTLFPALWPERSFFNASKPSYSSVQNPSTVPISHTANAQILPMVFQALRDPVSSFLPVFLSLSPPPTLSSRFPGLLVAF